MRIRFKKWARPELEASKFYIDNPKNEIGKWRTLFNNTNEKLYLELGCGKGNFISNIASSNLDINYIAIDLVDAMLGLAKRNVEEVYLEKNIQEINNVMLTRFDIERIHLILNKLDGIDRIYINFCNPWPKGQHRKKRLTHSRQLEKYKLFLKNDGEIYFKTDDDQLFESSLIYLEESGFEIIKKTYDLHKENIFDQNVVTEHEKMFSEEGIKIKAVIAKRKKEQNMKHYFTSESVTEGHPDKLCDTISDKILDGYLAIDENSRVAVETFAADSTITIAGQVTSNGEIDIEKIVRDTIKEIGFDDEKVSIDYKTCKVDINITKQSSDIALGVDTGGAGDQGIMFGYASDETEEYMPYAIWAAHKLSKRLTEVRKDGTLKYLRPDGKTQVTIEYEDDKPKRVETILISTQHDKIVTNEDLRKDIIEYVINTEIPKEMIDDKTNIYVNPTGRFVIGGPLGDTGLTGRKIIVDTYGGYSRHGGGAFSGKDPSKVDRSAAYMTRHIAKNIVANGFAKKCEIQVSYAIGMKEPLSIFVNTFGTGKIKDEEIVDIIKAKFDLTPNGIIKYLELKKPIYSKTTNYGHFGKKDLSWEEIIKM